MDVNGDGKLDNKEIAIVHGRGTGILKKQTFEILKNDNRIDEYNLDCFNDGCTLVRFKKK